MDPVCYRLAGEGQRSALCDEPVLLTQKSGPTSLLATGLDKIWGSLETHGWQEAFIASMIFLFLLTVASLPLFHLGLPFTYPVSSLTTPKQP